MISKEWKMAEQEESQRIGFRTTADWSASDVSVLSLSVSGIYDAFLTLEVRRSLQESYVEAMERSFRRYDKMFGDPMYHELFHLWRESLQIYRKRGLPWMPPLPFFPQLSGGFGPQVGSLPPDHVIYAELERHARESDRLRVYRIRMSSPGGFSFSGIGEIVKEFRELIKDLWWRNRQERVRGELEIIERYLSVRTQHPEIDFPPVSYPGADRDLVQVVSGHVKNLRSLEERGRLESVPDNIEYVPPE
jgi:hypothetical protein